MSLSEFISIFIASIAIIISFATLYFSHIRQKISLLGALVSVHQSDKSSYHDIYEFCLSNNGNREILIRDVEIVHFSNSVHTLVPDIKPEIIPMIIKPGQLQLIKINLPKLFMKKAFEAKESVLTQFHVYSTNGKLYLASKEVPSLLEKNNFKSNTWQPFKLHKPKSK